MTKFIKIFAAALAIVSCALVSDAVTNRIGALHPKNGIVVTEESDPTVPAWAKSETPPLTEEIGFNTFTNRGGKMYGPLKLHQAPFGEGYDFSTEITTNGITGWKYGGTGEGGAGSYWVQFSFNWWDLLTSESDPTVPGWAKATSKPSYAWSEITGKPTIPTVPTEQINANTRTNAEQDVSIGQVRQIVTTWENFLDGSNVVFSITNYISGGYNIRDAKLRILELRDGAYSEVYNSRDEILAHIENFKTNDFRVATNQVIGTVNETMANKADKAWGKYTSSGGVAPSNTVYMTAPNTVFAGGLEYERVAVGEGAICVLTTKGAPTWTQGDEGTFKFQDDGGTNYFGFAKTDSYTIGANTDGITVQSGVVTLTYNITMSGRPCIWYKASLDSNTPWEQLNLPDGSSASGASHAVSWDENPDPGTQVCYINVGSEPSGFFRATVEVAGEAKFMTNMPADLSGGIICPNTATGVDGVIKPTFNGTSVNWVWSAN